MMYEKKTLPNGVRILTEHVPGVRSVSLGLSLIHISEPTRP